MMDIISSEWVAVGVNVFVGVSLLFVAGVTLRWRRDELRREQYERDRDWSQSDTKGSKIVVSNVRNKETKSVQLQVWMPTQLMKEWSADGNSENWLKETIQGQCIDDEVSYCSASFDFKSWSQIVHAAKRENKVANRFIADLLKMETEKDR